MVFDIMCATILKSVTCFILYLIQKQTTEIISFDVLHVRKYKSRDSTSINNEQVLYFHMFIGSLKAKQNTLIYVM